MSNPPSYQPSPQKPTESSHAPGKNRMSLLHLDELALVPPISGVPLEAPLYIRIQVHVPAPSQTEFRIPVECLYGSDKVEVIKLQFSASFTMRDLLEMLTTRLWDMIYQIGREMLRAEGVTVFWDWKSEGRRIRGLVTNEGGETVLHDGNLRSAWGLLMENARNGKDVLLLRCADEEEVK